MKKILYLFGYQVLICSLLILKISPLYAAPINMNIQSGSSWLTTTTESAGWTTASFDDSAWINAYAPYPNVFTPQSITLPGTTAEYMWYWDSASAPNGSIGSDIAFFRYNFNLSLAPDSLPLIGQGFVAADDNFEFYVNGTQLLSSNPSINDINPAHFVDFSSLLQNGDNVLSIKAEDLGGFEWAFFDGIIKTTVAVPEPGTIVLLSLGMLGMYSNRKRRLKT